jgi:hypothetical protein
MSLGDMERSNYFWSRCYWRKGLLYMDEMIDDTNL